MDELIAVSVTSLVGFMTQEALVELGIGDNKVQLLAGEARQIALNILSCAAVAEADLFFIHFAMGKIGTDIQGAAVLLKEFRDWREARENG